jgi:hypothetical protein
MQKRLVAAVVIVLALIGAGPFALNDMFQS